LSLGDLEDIRSHLSRKLAGHLSAGQRDEALTEIRAVEAEISKRRQQGEHLTAPAGSQTATSQAGPDC